MKVSVLSSGSKGNTTYIETDNTKILIDIGNTSKYVKEKLEDIGVRPEDLHDEPAFLKGNKNPKIKVKVDVVEKLGAENTEARNIPLECYELISAKSKNEQEQIYRILLEIEKYKSN